MVIGEGSDMGREAVFKSNAVSSGRSKFCEFENVRIFCLVFNVPVEAYF